MNGSFRFFHFLASSWMKAVVCNSTLDKIVSSLVLLSSKTKFPTSFFSITFFMTVMKSRDTLSIFFTSIPFIWAFILQAIMRILNSRFDGNLIEAIVVEDTLPEIAGRGISLLSDTVGPTGLIVVAFVFTILEGSEAARILGAGSGLIRAVVSDAILRRHKGNSSFNFFDF